MSSPTKYRKLPVVIEAMEWDGSVLAAEDAVDWIRTGGHAAFCWDSSEGRYFVIQTLEGDMQVMPDDLIIKGVNGEFYPCKPDIFAKTYEVAE